MAASAQGLRAHARHAKGVSHVTASRVTEGTPPGAGGGGLDA